MKAHLHTFTPPICKGGEVKVVWNECLHLHLELSLPEMLGRYFRQAPPAKPACLPDILSIRQQQQAASSMTKIKSGRSSNP